MRTCHKLYRALAVSAALLLSAGAVAEPVTAYMDKQSDSLRAAQTRLINLGLLNGSADGAYGPKTADALSAFQDQNGLEATGHLDSQTLDLLTRVAPDSATAKDVQQRLIDYGYLQGTADGIIGPRSVAALRLFQKIAGLRASGKADAETLDALFSTEAVRLPAALNGGSKGEDVERLQNRLIQFGFMEGTADGSYGQATVNAVRAFQRHLGDQGYEEWITADGAASSVTQYCLYDDRYSTYLRSLAPGDSDDEVLRVQRRLRQLGYLDADPADTLDEYAQDALELFKQRAGLADACIGRETIDALFGASAPRAAYCAPHDIAAGDSGLAVREVQQALVSGGLMSRLPDGKYSKDVEEGLAKLYKYLQAEGDVDAELFADPKAVSAEAQIALQRGLLGYRTSDTDNKTEATRIQNRLYTLCYLPKSGIDGLFGRNSEKAIADFQSANGLIPTGEADEATQSLLFSDRAAAKPYPYRIEVSIDRQVVDVYELQEGGGYSLVQSFTCSTGLHDATPRGIFLDGHPVNRWHHFEKFNCWAQ